MKHIDEHEGGLELFSRGFRRFGIHREGERYVYREWAPGATCVYLFGEFNNWDRTQYLAKKVILKGMQNEYGVWELVISDKVIAPNSRVKAHVKQADGKYQDRIPAWINFATQNEDHTYDGVYIEDNYEWKHNNPTWPNDDLKIYECHIGMSGIEPKVHSYTYFKEHIIDRVVDLGYNAIQIMGVL